MSNDLELLAGACIAAPVGYVLWRKAMKARGLMHGTATSKIATAAKGFVELSGRARQASARSLTDPLTGAPCLWFHMLTERRGSRNRWEVIKRDTSSQAFVVEDDSGACAVVVREQEVERAKAQLVVKESSRLRHRLWWIRDGDLLYALGHLDRLAPGESIEPGPPAADAAQLAEALLREWKQDQPQLRSRYDANADGRIDAAEWENAREAARASAAAQVIERETRAPAALPGRLPITHRLSRPGDGRPMLVSLRPEAALARAKLGQSRLGLALFLGGAFYILSQLRRCVTG